jgi:hypothetical protein
MLVTLDIKNESMKDNFLNFIGTLDYINIKSNNIETTLNKKPLKHNKFDEFAGMWQGRDISTDTIRKEAWAK